MKRVIQLILFLILIIIIVLFYFKYFKIDKKVEIQETINDEKVEIQEKINPETNTDQTENNLIKNLSYEVAIGKNDNYKITSDLSEITYKNGAELILMKKVRATLKNETNNWLYINSDYAEYDNNNYNTNFKNNIEIRYLEKTISAENMFLNFKDKYVLINKNVKLDTSVGILKADNVRINLITKEINIFMNDKNQKIIINTLK